MLIPAHDHTTRRLDISYPIMDFTQKVKQWEQFDEGAMGIIVRHIKGYVCTFVFLISVHIYLNTSLTEMNGLAKQANVKARFVYLRRLTYTDFRVKGNDRSLEKGTC